MAVRATERSVSTLEYVYQARQIFYYVSDRLNQYEEKFEKDSKKYKDVVHAINHTLWNTPVYNAQMVFVSVQRANAIRIVDKESFNKRLAYLKQAEENLDLLETSITSLYDILGDKGHIKDKFLIELSQKIDSERKLIKGVKESDARRNI